MAQTTADDFAPRPAPLDGGRATPLDWTLNLTRVSWEVVAWLAVVPLALVLRLIWLDAWPMRAAGGGHRQHRLGAALARPGDRAAAD